MKKFFDLADQNSLNSSYLLGQREEFDDAMLQMLVGDGNAALVHEVGLLERGQQCQWVDEVLEEGVAQSLQVQSEHDVGVVVVGGALKVGLVLEKLIYLR